MSNRYTKPFSCVLVNAPGHYDNGKYVCNSFRIIKDTLRGIGYLVTKIRPLWFENQDEFAGVVIIEFGASTDQCISAFKLSRMFEAANHGHANFLAADPTQPQPYQPYLWIATESDRHYFHYRNVEYVQISSVLRNAADYEANGKEISAYANIVGAFVQMYL